MQSAPIPALVISRDDGTVIAQNQSARRLMGDGLGRACWSVVGTMPNAEGLPCAPGCVRRLLRRRLDEARHTPILLRGERHTLTCVPAMDSAVCMLSGPMDGAVEPRQRLTRREVEVLRMVADGATTSEIAVRLRLSACTVRTHVENIRNKLGGTTRAGLVALGFRLGFLD